MLNSVLFSDLFHISATLEVTKDIELGQVLEKTDMLHMFKFLVTSGKDQIIR